MNEESEYCLRWHRHLTNFIESFENLLENEYLADVFFFVEGELVKAHKVVLSSCSNYFKTLFKETIERHPIIILKDAKLAHIKMLLEFMYRGTVNIPQEALDPIMKMAETLNIKGLADGVVDIEKVDTDVENEVPMSLIHPKIPQNHYNTPPPQAQPVVKHERPPMPTMYNAPSTSVHSVLSNALTMPSALSLTSPLSLPHLASLPPNFASSLASTLSNAIPHSIASFIPPRDRSQSESIGAEPPMHKRRRKQRRKSGDVPDSGDSDGRSSGSPGDSVSNLHLPRIPATITPIGLHRQQMQQQQQQQQQYPQNSQYHQLQPRDLSVHSTQNHSSNLSDHDRSSHNSPHKDRPLSIKPPPNIPGLLHHPSLETNHNLQEEPENLEHRPSPSLQLQEQTQHQSNQKSQPEKVLKVEPANTEEQNSNPVESPQTEKEQSPLTSGRRSNDGSLPQRPSPKCSSDPESLVSPAKQQISSQGRNDDTSSDNNHLSEDERDERSNGRRENLSERLSDSTPGPSTSRPQSEEAPHTPNFLGWPYSNDNNSNDEHFSNFGPEANHNYFRALNLVRAGISGILPQRMPGDLYARPQVPINLPFLLKGGKEKSAPKNLLGYPFPESPKQFTCEKCGRSYASTGNLKRHKKYECGVEPQFSCPICKKKFQHRHSVKIHVFSTHRNEAGDPSVEANREGPAMFSTAESVPSVGAASWIPQEASTAPPQNQEG